MSPCGKVRSMVLGKKESSFCHCLSNRLFSVLLVQKVQNPKGNTKPCVQAWKRPASQQRAATLSPFSDHLLALAYRLPFPGVSPSNSLALSTFAGPPVRVLHTMGGDGADAAGARRPRGVCCRRPPAARVCPHFACGFARRHDTSCFPMHNHRRASCVTCACPQVSSVQVHCRWRVAT